MRPSILERGPTLKHRLFLRLMRVAGRTDPDPVVKMMFHRPDLFGRRWGKFVEQTMRGPSLWTPGERELFAAFVSRLNTCRFCAGVHTYVADLQLRTATTSEKLDNWREADFDPRVIAVLGLLEKVTLDPGSVRAADVDTARATGVSDTAITDALNIAFLFNTINRLANAFDFVWATEHDRSRLALGLNRVRYHVPSFLLR